MTHQFRITRIRSDRVEAHIGPGKSPAVGALHYRAIEKMCYENDLENTVLCLGRIYSVVHDRVYISAEIALFSK